MVEYYAQRASAGLIIAEATMIQENQSAFWTEPGIYSAEQVQGWKKVTDAVHARQGRIFLQIWHGGRACAPENSEGTESVAPSAIAISNHVGAEFNPSGEKIKYSTPRALTEAEIQEIIALYATAAKNAIEAGFDGVEIHGANGYLIDEFLRESANKRDAPYGGSIENRARFAIEVVEAVVAAIGADRVGIRLSPLNSYNDMKDSDPAAVVKYLCTKLSELKIAFVHMMRADFYGLQKGDVLKVARENFKGVIIANMGYEIDEAEEAIKAHEVDAVCFGVKFIANPDLPERAAKQAPLNVPRPQFFYARGAEGYTDYPTMQGF